MPPATNLPAEPPRRARSFRTDRTRKAARRDKFADRLASAVIRLGGGFVILTVAAIFLFVGKEALPLFLPAQASVKSQSPDRLPGLQGNLWALGLDEYETFAYGLSSTGTVHFWNLQTWEPQKAIPLKKLGQGRITAAYRTPARDQLFIGTEEGNVLLAQIRFQPLYSETGRTVDIKIGGEKLIEVAPGSRITHLAGRTDKNDAVHFAVATEDGQLRLGVYAEGDDPRVETLGGVNATNIVGLALDENGKKVFAATADGKLYHWYTEKGLDQPYAVLQPGENHRQISAMDFLIGDASLLLGYGDGSVEQWFAVRDADEGLFRPFQKIRSFESLPKAVTLLQPSGRDKSFLAASLDGTVRLFYTTTGHTLLDLPLGTAAARLAYAPKLTSVLAVDESYRARQWEVHSRHPEISWQTLFGKVWYEGYDRPDYAWQSTGGTDNFEPKLSLTPLIFGTLKGAIYGLLFAIPVSVLAAIYTSQFMSIRLRGLVKPAVEIMAALPSVVIGFLAGLWLAPILEHHILSLLTAALLLPVFILAAVLVWNVTLSRPAQSRLPMGTELGVITAVVFISIVIAFNVGPIFEGLFFDGDFRQWIFHVTGQAFEQRNSIVIGFAMGFGVIPIIFTLSEDALSNVPAHFVSGSLALGANRWQTALHIVLPTASPGIFSGVMVGFGRAVGETMIVLMATGNTPILSLSPFNGMRTLSANIAVEIPEAPVAGTLYRILFLTAILLFLMTFAVNTVAEIVRQRLREKYKAV